MINKKKLQSGRSCLQLLAVSASTILLCSCANFPVKSPSGDQALATDADQATDSAGRAMPTKLPRQRVVSIQDRLRDAGFDPGKSNGTMNRDTVLAMFQFKIANGMPVSNVVTDEFLVALGL